MPHRQLERIFKDFLHYEAHYPRLGCGTHSNHPQELPPGDDREWQALAFRDGDSTRQPAIS
ncbi:MAG: hypothetical protein QNJ34_16905 [Xenococcaceae cyanobacterium MO_188.B29]|nr:hypothetical protein [Xenococcaceae cyanobacterium MO_188.B29]